MEVLDREKDKAQIDAIASKTLFVGRWNSSCGNCGKTAHLDQFTHENIASTSHEARQLKGCGARWEYITSTYEGGGSKEKTKEARPDLTYVGYENVEDGDDIRVMFVVEND